MKPLRILLPFLLLSGQLPAETVFLKDGKVHAAKEMRRDGNFLFLKVPGPNGALADVLTPLNQIDRVDFGDPPAPPRRANWRGRATPRASSKKPPPPPFFSEGSPTFRETSGQR